MRLDYIVFGYVRFKIAPTDVLRAVKILKKHSISVKINSDGEFFTSVFKMRKVAELLSTRVEFSRSEILGMGGFVYKNRKRYGVFCALFTVALLWALSSLLVWDIRVEGVEYEDCVTVANELSECGLFVGTAWHRIDTSVVERALLETSDTVGWVNINRRGSVAYVKVLKKTYHEKEEKKEGYSSVVAAFDGVVEEITVKKGVAAVREGDTVKKGDLLISGILPSELGGGFCHADGNVYLRVSEEISVSVDGIKEEKNISDTKISGFRIKIFNFCAKIFRNSRNLSATCDIIEETKEIKVKNKRLPIVFHIERSKFYTIKAVTLTPEEMTAEASRLMLDALNLQLKDATLLRIKTEGEFTEGGYTMRASVVAVRNGATSLDFNKS